MTLLSVILGLVLGLLGFLVGQIISGDRRVGWVVGILVFVLVAFQLIPFGL
jgi:hypothetical protein